MADLSKQELADQGKAFKAAFAPAKQTPQNFALFVGPKDIVLLLDRKKKYTVLARQAKSEAGGSKGISGFLSLDGKSITLTHGEGQKIPPNLGKTLRKFLSNRGLNYTAVELIVSSDIEVEAEEGAAEDGAAGVSTPATETTSTSDTPPPADAQPADRGLKEKLEKAALKIAPAIKAAITDAPAYTKSKIVPQRTAYLAQMKAEEYGEALVELTKLRDILKAVPSEAGLTSAISDATDPEKLAAKLDVVKNLDARRASDPTFAAKAKPQFRDLRKSLKAALKTAAPKDKAALEAMKKTLDDACLAFLKEEGHGPQRHEGDVSADQLKDRCVSGKDPMTGTTTDGAHGGTHKFSRHATRFIDAGTYVDADENLRDSAQFTTKKDLAKATNDTRFKVVLPLSAAIGTDFASKLEGFSRVGSVNNPGNPPSQATDFTGGTLIAIYERQSDGTDTLLTMYPNPA